MTVQEFLQPRFLFILDYPGSEFCEGDVLQSFESDGRIYLSANAKLEPKKFPKHFKLLRWHDHRTIEELYTIKYMKVLSGSNYYVVGDIVEVIGVHYSTKQGLEFDLQGRMFFASQLEPATPEQYEKFKGQ